MLYRGSRSGSPSDESLDSVGSERRRSKRKVPKKEFFDASKNASARGLAKRDMIEHKVYYLGENVPVKITINEQLRTKQAVACELAAGWAAHQIDTNSFWNDFLNYGGGFTKNPRIHIQVLRENDKSYGKTSLWAELNKEIIEVYACPHKKQQALLHALQKPNGLQLEVLIDLNPKEMHLAGIGKDILAMSTLVHEWFIHAIHFIRTARGALGSPQEHFIRVVNGDVELKNAAGSYERNKPREKREHDLWMELYLKGDKEDQEKRAKGLFEKVGILPTTEKVFKRAFDHDLYLMKHGTGHERPSSSKDPDSASSASSKASKGPRAESPSTAGAASRSESPPASRAKEAHVAPRTEPPPSTASSSTRFEDVERRRKQRAESSVPMADVLAHQRKIAAAAPAPAPRTEPPPSTASSLTRFEDVERRRKQRAETTVPMADVLAHQRKIANAAAAPAPAPRTEPPPTSVAAPRTEPPTSVAAPRVEPPLPESLRRRIERVAPDIFTQINDALPDDANFPAKEFRLQIERSLGVDLNRYRKQMSKLANRLLEELPED